MRKLIWSIVFISFYWCGYSQVSTISTNIYQSNGKLGIGTTVPGNEITVDANYSSGLERNLIKLNNLDDGGMSYTGIILKTGDSNLMSAIQDYGINYTA
ncbi:MAG: hypothetical protein GQ564_11920, partial [Bacteroidales bacterium]|nr:hypothetical protein [Bacteroidales bacterium]